MMQDQNCPTSDQTQQHMQKIKAKHAEMNASAKSSPHANVQNDTSANDFGNTTQGAG